MTDPIDTIVLLRTLAGWQALPATERDQRHADLALAAEAHCRGEIDAPTSFSFWIDAVFIDGPLPIAFHRRTEA